MHDFEARVLHQAFGVEVRILRQPRGSDGINARWVRITAALGVGVDIEFDLTYTGVELLIKRAGERIREPDKARGWCRA